MKSKERVKNIIAKKTFDRIPYSFDMTSFIIKKVAAYFGIEDHSVSEFIGDDLKYIWPYDPFMFATKTLDDNKYIDRFGVVRKNGEDTISIGDWGGLVSSPLVEPSLEGYDYPDSTKGRWFDVYDENNFKNADQFIIVGIDGLFDRSWYVRGFENVLMDFIVEEKFVSDLLDKALEFNLGIIEQVPSYVDGIRFGEDWGQQSGLIMGHRNWRKYLKPRLKIMYEATRKKGLNVFIHTCGDIDEIIPDVIEIGVDVVNPIQPEVMDVEALKRNYGKDIVFYGGMGCQSTLPNGSVRDVLEEANRRLDVLGKDGGYIFGPSGAISTDAKIENVIALIEYVRNGYK